MSAISDDDLMAFADGQLAPERAAVVAAAVAADPELGQRAAALRAQSAALREALDPWLAEPIPSRLLAAAASPPQPSVWNAWRPYLAVAATLLLGLAIGWYGRDATLERSGTPTTFARAAAFTHVLYAADQRRPVEVWANEEKGLVTWLTRRLGTPAHAPDLNALGFALVGGRLVAGHEKPTALLMYENAEKQRLTLQWRRNDASVEETAFRYAVENGVGVFYWIETDCSYALSGRVDKAQLLAIARVVYGQLAAADAQPPQK
jgi:anti-sigma factor RsiW